MVGPIQRGTCYRFRLADVICPDRSQILNQIQADLEVTGEVMLLSDGGKEPGKFAIVEVEGIEGPLIVPVERLASTEAAPNQLDSRYERVVLEK